MLSSEDRFNIIKQSIAGQIEGPAYEAIQAAEQESLQANTEEAPQSEQQTQIPQTPVGPPPAQTIPRVYDQLGSLIEPGSTGVGLNQMAGTSPGQTIQPGEYKTGGPKDGDPTKKWPALKNLGDFTVTSDSNFTQGYGNIEYFSPKQDTIRYELGNPETYRPHPNPGHHSVVYNPNKFKSQKDADQAIRLDLLHGMPKADSEYKKNYGEFSKAFKKRNKGDIEQGYKRAKAEGYAQDGKKAWVDNYVDGTIRNLLFEGTDKEFSDAKYWKDARKVYLKDENTKNTFSKLENYLETGYKNLLPQVDLIEKKKTGGPKDPHGSQSKYHTPFQIKQGKMPHLLHLESDLNTFIGNPKHERVDPKNTKAYKDFEKGREAIGKKKQKLVDSLNERYEKNFEYSDLTQAERDKFENYNKEINAFENSELAKKVNKEGKWFDEKADPLRHVYTSAVTSKNISDKIKNIPYLGKVADFTGADDAIGMVGSNVLGAGHELAAWGNALSKNKGFLANLKESGQDMYNNFLGSYIGVTSDNKEEIEKKTTNYVKSGYTAAGKVSGDSVYKTGGPKSKAPKPLTKSDAKLEKEWPLMLQKQRFVESGFNTNAKSSKGATGSAQIMPDTLDYAKMKGWVPETISMKDLTGAEGYSISKHIQEKYMDNLFNRSWNKGTNEAKKAKALLAYNWGPENTRVKLNKLIDQGVNVWDNTDFTKYFNEESRQYKGKILDDLTTKKDPYVQRDYKKLKDLSPLLRMHGGPKVLYNNKKLKK